MERYKRSLAALIAEDTGAGPDDIEPWVVANALLGVHAALIDFVRRRTLAGAENLQVAEDLVGQTEAGFEVLAGGLRGYGVRGKA